MIKFASKSQFIFKFLVLIKSGIVARKLINLKVDFDVGGSQSRNQFLYFSKNSFAYCIIQ